MASLFLLAAIPAMQLAPLSAKVVRAPSPLMSLRDYVMERNGVGPYARSYGEYMRGSPLKEDNRAHAGYGNGRTLGDFDSYNYRSRGRYGGGYGNWGHGGQGYDGWASRYGTGGGGYGRMGMGGYNAYDGGFDRGYDGYDRGYDRGYGGSGYGSGGGGWGSRYGMGSYARRGGRYDYY